MQYRASWWTYCAKQLHFDFVSSPCSVLHPHSPPQLPPSPPSLLQPLRASSSPPPPVLISPTRTTPITSLPQARLPSHETPFTSPTPYPRTAIITAIQQSLPVIPASPSPTSPFFQTPATPPPHPSKLFFALCKLTSLFHPTSSSHSIQPFLVTLTLINF